MPEPTNGAANGHPNGRVAPEGQVHNVDPNRREPTVNDLRRLLAENAADFRTQFFSRMFSQGPADLARVDADCGYPSTSSLNDPWYFRCLYEREPMATRVCQLMPKESWQVSPLVYEDEDPENDTEFEKAWDQLGQALRGEASWFGMEEGSPIWERLQRGDQLSGIGYFGVLLVGIDDGRNLDQPADGVMTLNPVRNQLWPSLPRSTPNPNDPKAELTHNRAGVEFAPGDYLEPSAPMVPVLNSRKGTVDFVTVRDAERKLATNQLVFNAPPGLPRADRGFGPNQGRHEPDSTAALTSGGTEPFSPLGGESFTSFAGAQGTDAQYVGVELSPPEYPKQDGPSKKRRQLLFLNCFDEALVQIVQYEADVRNPRFGRPVMYRITLNDPSTQHSGVGLPLATVRVHWSRVIHLADNLDVSNIFGVPRMRPVLNPILDCRKVRGASAEGYWKSAFTGIALSTHPQLGGDVIIDEEKTKQILQDYFQNLDRGMVLSGMAASTISPQVIDPTPHIAVHIEAICIQLGCPIRVFKGSERGELASSQDDSSWNDRVKHRQRCYLTPLVIVPFIDRMISLGVLPEPKAKKQVDQGEPADPVGDARAKSANPFDEDQGEESNDGDSQAAKEDTGGPAVGQGSNPFLKKPQPTSNIRWRKRGRVVAYGVINAFGQPQVKKPEELEEDDQVIAKKVDQVDVADVPSGYSIEWPDIDSTTQKDKAGIALQETQALAAYVSGNLESILPPLHYYTDVMQWPEERARQIVDDAKEHQSETMTMPAAGDQGHPATGEPEPPPKPVNPLQVPKGTTFKGPGDANPLQHPGGIAFTPPPPPGAMGAPGGMPQQNPPPGAGAVAQMHAGQPKMPVQNANPQGINQYSVGISKAYFPKSIHPKELVQEFQEQFHKVKAASRTEAAQRVWGEHGDRLQSMMEPHQGKLPRKISLHVSGDKDRGRGMGRLRPVTVNFQVISLPLGQVGWDPDFTPLTRGEWRQSFYAQMRDAELTGNAFDPDAPRGPDGAFLTDDLTQNDWVTLETGQHVFIGEGGAFKPEGPGSEPVQVEPAGKGRVPATVDEATRRIDRFQKLFASRGNHEVADWMGKLRDHVRAVGADEALKSLGAEGGRETGEKVQYVHGFDNMSHFAGAYLDRHGISSAYHSQGATPTEKGRIISAVSPKFVEGSDVEKLGKILVKPDKGNFIPRDPKLANKLQEAKNLPGLEKSEDINKIMGHEVTHLTPEVTAKMDERYGKGKWIIKAFGDEAAAGYGIYFPQRAAQIQQDAKSTIHEASGEVAKHGFSLRRGKSGDVIGLQHTDGEHYNFGSKKYNETIDGHVRYWGDKAAAAAPHERGAQLPDGGKDFMAQPAFKAVGVSDADRAAGKTIAPGESRVHITTKNGVASVVPHSTWIKGEHMPVVFEDNHTRAMAKAAVDAINKLPKSERMGQIYAPDIIKAEDGYRVVEANPANSTGSSGYLNDNPLVIDSYVSHLTGREPAHVRFIRSLLSTKK